MDNVDASESGDLNQKKNLRVSDADREAASNVLQDAVARGLITLEEFSERTDQALASRTRGDLDRIFADLPLSVAPSAAGNVDKPLELRTGVGTIRQSGEWEVPSEIVVEGRMGNILVDFTQARCRHHQVTMRIDAGAGNVLVIVPRGWRVRLEEAVSGLGTVSSKANDTPDPSMPVLLVYARSGIGHVRLRHPRRYF